MNDEIALPRSQNTKRLAAGADGPSAGRPAPWAELADTDPLSRVDAITAAYDALVRRLERPVTGAMQETQNKFRATSEI